MACIYGLYSSSNPNHIRYIGRSQSDTPDARLISHIYEAKSGNTKTHKCYWIQKVIADGDEIKAVLIENNLSWEKSGEKEIYYISYYKKLGHKLTNLTIGGDGAIGMKHTEATRKKMSASRMNYKFTPEAIENMRKVQCNRSIEHRQKISIAHKGKPKSESHKAKLKKPKSPEHIEKMRQANLGKKLSEETKKKISIAGKGRIVNEDTRRKLSIAKKGFRHTEKSKEKNRLAHLGKKASPETKLKMSLKRRGVKRKPLSYETKKKISDTLIRRNSELRMIKNQDINGGA